MTKLFAYQIEGAKWLTLHPHRLLADEMGLGKSAQAITACDHLGAKSILVLGPAVSRPNWLREFEKFSSQKREFEIVKTRGQELSPGAFVICSYDLLESVQEQIVKTKWDVVILDECHMLKNPEAKRTQSVWGKKGVARCAKRIFAISGTPAPNHAGELWPILVSFGATRLPYSKFVERYCDTFKTSYRVQVIGTKKENVPELRQILSPHMLRRRKEDVMKDLPPIVFSDYVVDPGLVDIDISATFIKWVFPLDRRAELKALLESERMLVTNTVGKTGLGRDGMEVLKGLAKSVSTLRMYNGAQKVEGTAALIRSELESNAYEKIVIFAIHVDVIEGLRLALREFGVVTLYGGTDPEKRQRNIDKFQNNPKCRVFIGNIQAAGTNITLTAAHHVTFVEQDWVPGNNAQAMMRCHRIGQTKPVFVRFIGLADSIDEKIANILKRKTRELTEIFDPDRLTTLRPLR